MRYPHSSPIRPSKSRQLRLESLEAREVPAATFQIASLTANTVGTVTHDFTTGDDQGGIATTGSKVFVTGAFATGSFDLSDLANPASIGVRHEALASNIRTRQAYVLGNVDFAFNINPITSTGGQVTHLIPLDGVTGLRLTGQEIPLTSSFSVASGTGIFSGYDRIVVHPSNLAVYEIDLTPGSLGQVTTLNPLLTTPIHNSSATWAYWGVTEHFGNEDYLTYVASATQIKRTKVQDGSVSQVPGAVWTDLADMASFTVSPSNNRWYFHHEGPSQFVASAAGDEVVGYADATFQIGDLVVTNLTDSDPGSLRAMITLANSLTGAQTIGFQSGLNGTITLLTPISVSEAASLDGPGSGTITVTGTGTNALFASAGTPVLSMGGLTLSKAAVDGLAFALPLVTLGDVVITAGAGNVSFANNLTVSAGTLTVVDGNAVDLAPLTTVNGNLTAANGYTVTANEVLTGTGNVNGAVTLAANSKLAGNVSVTGNVLVQATGEIEPGFTNAGTITIDGNLTVQSDGTLDFAFDGPNSGDKLVVSGTVDLGTGTNFNPTITYPASPGHSFTMIQKAGIDAVTGLLNNVRNRSGLSVGGTLVQVRYDALTGNDLQLFVNSAPALNTAVDTKFDPILEDVPPLSNPGTTIDNLIATGNLYADAQGLPRGGVAITGFSSGSGVWELSTNGGSNWNSLGTLLPTSATLLEADGAGRNRIRFRPNGDFFGTATVSFKGWDTANGLADVSIGVDASIGGGNFAYSAETETAQILVLAVNDNPVAVADAYSVAEDVTLNVAGAVGVLANDSDIDGPLPLTASLVNGPAHGSLTLNSDGSFTYVPVNDFFGGDSFTYKVKDGDAAFNVGTVTINVTNSNDNPVARNDSVTLPEDGGAVPIDVLANDTALPDANETLTIASATSGLHGTVAIDGSGTFVTYIPDVNYNGPDSFTYTTGDGNGGSASATVNVTVTSVNDLPDAVNDSATVNEDGGEQTIDVLANDSFIPDAGETLFIVNVSQGQHGTVQIVPGGLSLTYTPNGDYSGPDSFFYTVGDGNGGTDVAAVGIDVVNDLADRLELVTTPGTVTFTESVPPPQTAIVVDGGIRVGTALEGVISSASVKFTSGYVTKKDILMFSTLGAIKGKFNAKTGTLALTGTASPADYQAALRTVKYVNNSPAPVDGVRTIMFQVNDVAGSGTPASKLLRVIGVNTKPILTLTGPAPAPDAQYKLRGKGLAVASKLKIVDVDNTRLVSASVSFGAGFQAGDILTVTAKPTTGITVSYNLATGLLTLTGNATLKNYLAVLKSLKFTTPIATQAGLRTLNISVNDGVADSDVLTRKVNVV